MSEAFIVKGGKDSRMSDKVKIKMSDFKISDLQSSDIKKSNVKTSENKKSSQNTGKRSETSVIASKIEKIEGSHLKSTQNSGKPGISKSENSEQQTKKDSQVGPQVLTNEVQGNDINTATNLEKVEKEAIKIINHSNAPSEGYLTSFKMDLINTQDHFEEESQFMSKIQSSQGNTTAKQPQDLTSLAPSGVLRINSRHISESMREGGNKTVEREKLEIHHPSSFKKSPRNNQKSGREKKELEEIKESESTGTKGSESLIGIENVKISENVQNPNDQLLTKSAKVAKAKSMKVKKTKKLGIKTPKTGRLNDQDQNNKIDKTSSSNSDSSKEYTTQNKKSTKDFSKKSKESRIIEKQMKPVPNSTKLISNKKVENFSSKKRNKQIQ